MLSIAEARRAILERASTLPRRRVPLAEALYCILAEDVVADVDSPPFDKALVDGYAVRSTDCTGDPPFRLRVGEEIPAGRTPSRPLGLHEAAAIMTGAPMPPGSDAVVMVEQSRIEGSQVVLTPTQPIRVGQNRMDRGREMRTGDGVLSVGSVLGAAKLALLASVGHVDPLVHPRPHVRIVPTGDELVEPAQTPGPGQIRNSNATLLQALVRSDLNGLIATAEVSPIAPDDPPRLLDQLAWGLQADALLVTGGVSAGRRDLVPGALSELGVEPVFHKVRVKPGKPIWFGIGPRRAPDRPGALVFGLPGNPASTLVGFYLFVSPALDTLWGRGGVLEPSSDVEPRGELLPITRPFAHRGDRPTYHPAQVGCDPDGGDACVELVGWAGSADLRALANAAMFAVFPAGDRDYQAGDLVRVVGPYQ